MALMMIAAGARQREELLEGASWKVEGVLANQDVGIVPEEVKVDPFSAYSRRLLSGALIICPEFRLEM
jgi:hypothetical protein